MSSNFEIKPPKDVYEPSDSSIDKSAETELWDNFRNGCEKSLVIVFDKYVRVLFKYGYKIVPDEDLVKDCIQELFIDLWRRHQELGAASNIKFYLFKSLRRKISRVQSTSGKNVFLEDLAGDYEFQSESSYELKLVNEQNLGERKKAILFHMESLPARQKEALYLKFFEGLNYEEMANIMSLTKQSAYNLVNKAIEALKQCFICIIYCLCMWI